MSISKLTRLIKHNFHFYKRYFITWIVYVFYLLTLPHIIALFIPCLKLIPYQTFNYADCNILIVLDLYAALTVAGLAIVVVFIFLGKLKSLKILVFAIVVLTLTAIVAYYANLLPFIRQIESARLYLDSISR